MNAQDLRHELKTQDNMITANPIFIVQQRREIAGIDADYADKFAWVKDGERIDDETETKLEKRYCKTGIIPRSYSRVGYTEIWEFVTACLTRKGCEDYIKANGHNLDSPRIYVEGGFRNAEWAFVRKYFMDLEENR